MSDDRLDLEAVIDALQRAPLPPERAGLRADLLAAYARTVAPARRLRLVRRILVVTVAAAALVLLSLSWPEQRPDSRAELALRPDSRAEIVLLDASVARLRASVEQLCRERMRVERTVQREAEHDSGPEPNADRLLAIVSDASVLRLASARAFENVDSAAASSRYREIVDQFPGGPAAAVARDRLAILSQ